MGWCAAFGPQIREGCDHPMAAGRDACHCAECGATCHGRFSGCATVWAAATPVTGDRGATVSSVAVAPVRRAPGSAGVAEPAGVRALRVDMQLLMWKVDRLRDEVRAVHDAGDSVSEVAGALAALPDQVERAVARALRTQRRETGALVAASERRILDAIADAVSIDLDNNGG